MFSDFNLTRKSALTIAGVVILILLLVFTTIQNGQLMERNDQLVKDMADLTFALDATGAEKQRLEEDLIIAQEEIEKFTEKVEELDDLLVASQIDKKQFMDRLLVSAEPSAEVVSRLKGDGFASVHDFLATLRLENDLIPYEGVLGGTMAWWPKGSYVLTEHFVLGYFEDGHVGGYAVLEYEIDPVGNVEWTLLKARIME